MLLLWMEAQFFCSAQVALIRFERLAIVFDAIIAARRLVHIEVFVEINGWRTCVRALLTLTL